MKRRFLIWILLLFPHLVHGLLSSTVDKRPTTNSLSPFLLFNPKRYNLSTTLSLKPGNSFATLCSMANESKEGQEVSSSTSSSSLSSSWWDVMISKIGSTTSIVVAGTFYAVLAYQRDSLMVSFFIGAISNGILSKLLKKILKQERPAGITEYELLSNVPPSDNGMPSSHAMSLGFISTFTALQLPWTVPILLPYVIISLIYRVRSNLHSLEQILVGLVLGSLNGAIWRSLCFGTNLPIVELPTNIHVMDWVRTHLLNEHGVLPWYGLAVPALVGAAVVGSIERRISRLLESAKSVKAG